MGSQSQTWQQLSTEHDKRSIRAQCLIAQSRSDPEPFYDILKLIFLPLLCLTKLISDNKIMYFFSIKQNLYTTSYILFLGYSNSSSSFDLMLVISISQSAWRHLFLLFPLDFFVPLQIYIFLFYCICIFWPAALFFFFQKNRLYIVIRF